MCVANNSGGNYSLITPAKSGDPGGHGCEITILRVLGAELHCTCLILSEYGYDHR